MEYEDPIITEITPEEYHEMLENLHNGEGSKNSRNIFICHEINRWLAIDNSKGDFSTVKFVFRSELEDWLVTGTKPSDYFCSDVVYSPENENIYYEINIGEDRYVTVKCQAYTFFNILDNPFGGQVSGPNGMPDEDYIFCEEAAINLAKQHCKKRFPELFNSEQKHEKAMVATTRRR